MNWEQMQDEHREWLSRQFPGQPPDVPAAGLVEEAGELLAVIGKLNQEARWGVEPRCVGRTRGVELIDAIGDCAIYACSMCNALGWDYESVVTASPYPCGTSLQDAVNFVKTCSLAACGPFRQYKLMDAMSALKGLSGALSVDFEEAVRRTWEEVKARNRKDRPKPRIVTLCGSLKFLRLFREARFAESLRGNLVFTVDTDDDEMRRSFEATPEQKQLLRRRHFDQILASDEILVLDGPATRCSKCSTLYPYQRVTKCSCGSEEFKKLNYYGEHTLAEMNFATDHGKDVRFWSQEHEAT